MIISTHDPLYNHMDNLFNQFDIFYKCSKALIPQIAEIISSEVLDIQWLESHSQNIAEGNIAQLKFFITHEMTFRSENIDLIWKSKVPHEEIQNNMTIPSYNLDILRHKSDESLIFTNALHDLPIIFSKHLHESVYRVNQTFDKNLLKDYIDEWATKIDKKMHLIIVTEKFFSLDNAKASPLLFEQNKNYYLMSLYAYQYKPHFDQIYIHCINNDMFDVDNVEVFFSLAGEQAKNLFKKYKLKDNQMNQFCENWILSEINSDFIEKLKFKHKLSENLPNYENKKIKPGKI